MKKLFTLFTVIAMSLTAMATDYTGALDITMFGSSLGAVETTISVNQQTDGNYTFTLKNFSIPNMMNVGTVEMSDIEGTTDENGTVTLSASQTVTIQDGDDPDVTWSMAGTDVSVTINAEMTATTLTAQLSISVSGLPVSVSFEGTAVAGNSTNYTDMLYVSLPTGSLDPVEATITITEQADGKYTFALKNFSIAGLMNVGTVELTDVEGKIDENGKVIMNTTQTATIQNGDDPDVIWALAGTSVDVTMYAEMTSDKLYAELTIAVLGMNVNVVFGSKEEDLVSTDYTDNLYVTIYGSAFDAVEATVTIIEQADGKYTFALKNFSMPGLMDVGTVEMTDVEGTPNEDGVIIMNTTQTATIQNGDDPNVTWALAGTSVDVTMYAEMTSNKLYAELTIGVLGMNVDVVFGSKITSSIGAATTVNNNGIEAVYDLNGRRMNGLSKGLNIIRKADGTVVKVLQK